MCLFSFSFPTSLFSLISLLQVLAVTIQSRRRHGPAFRLSFSQYDAPAKYAMSTANPINKTVNPAVSRFPSNTAHRINFFFL